MSLSIGIIGLPNAGKSTLFNALAARRLAETSPRPFTTINPHEAVVPVPDENLQKLAKLLSPQKVVSATIKFIDIAGLIKGAHKGEGLGNQFLAKIREVDLIVHVINAYQAKSKDEIIEDYQTIRTELALADLGSLEKATPKDLVTILIQKLNSQKPINLHEFSPKDMETIKSFFLLSIKPELVVLNINEAATQSTSINQIANAFPNSIVLSARLAEDFIDLDESEKSEFLKEYQLEESGLNSLINRCYELLNLITFYTIKGGREVSAFSLKKGSSALDAAAKVHSDFARNFIKAEVVHFSDFISLKSWKTCREQGRARTEGRDYLVQDRDIIEFKIGT